MLANRLTDAAGNTNQGVSQLLGGLAIDTLDLRILATADPVVVQRDLANDLPDWAFTAAPDRRSSPVNSRPCAVSPLVRRVH